MIGFDSFGDRWRFWIGRLNIIVADPCGAIDFYRYMKWTGIIFCWRDSDEEGCMMKVLGRWSYREWSIDKRLTG
jgi:hypothetical protein